MDPGSGFSELLLSWTILALFMFLLKCDESVGTIGCKLLVGGVVVGGMSDRRRRDG